MPQIRFQKDSMKFFIFILFLVSCKEVQKSKTVEEATKAPNQNEIVRDSASLWVFGRVVENESIAYYLPSSIEGNDSAICLLFFDPQGNGKVPLNLYKEIGEKESVFFVGSNQSKNGKDFSQTRQIASQMMEQVTKFSGFKKVRFYASGFSGGAKVALDLSNYIPQIQGFIYSGAPPANEIQDKPVYGFAGNMDMNYADLVNFDDRIPDTQNHYLKIWNGKHEWPVPLEFQSALQWIKLRERPRSGLLEIRLVELFLKSRRTKDLLEKESVLLESRFLARDLKRPELEDERLKTLQKSPGFLAAKKKRDQELMEELQLKEFYNPAFFDENLDWWKKEIAGLKAHTRHPSPNVQDRLLGYFSLASYSLANRALLQQENNLAEKILEIYHLSDPQNPEQAYLRAVLAARVQNPDKVLEFLSEALDLGFKEKERIRLQPEFQPYAENPGFQSIVMKLDK